MPMLGLEYGGRRRLVDREGMADFRCMSHRGANSIHAVPADCAQGMHAGRRGGSPVRADGERRGSADWQGRDGRTLLFGLAYPRRTVVCECRMGRQAVL